ncbi:hypothetical protein SAMN04488499_1003220 [Sporomusa acidovorans]|nr:hypothetical protein SPACI_31320 [Sporomusa acidovorans DSM 3132]SDD74071.1 hypothetical protein SAMN04488499_1003220 [Sporomusa acidovorans]
MWVTANGKAVCSFSLTVSFKTKVREEMDAIDCVPGIHWQNLFVRKEKEVALLNLSHLKIFRLAVSKE